MLLNRQSQQYRQAQYGGKGIHPALAVIGEHDLGLSCLPGSYAGLLTSWDFYVMSGSFTVADFSATGENSGTNAMSADGLLITTGNTNGNGNWLQLIRSKLPAANKLQIAHGRMSLGDVTNTGFVFGLSETAADWFAAEGPSNAAFLKAKGAATVVGRSRDGTNGSSTGTLLTAVNDTLYDFTVIYDGFANVIRYGVKAATAAWNRSHWTTKDTNLPDDKQRLTIVYENNEGAVNTLLIDRLVWGAMK